MKNKTEALVGLIPVLHWGESEVIPPKTVELHCCHKSAIISGSLVLKYPLCLTIQYTVENTGIFVLGKTTQGYTGILGVVPLN